MCVNVQVDYDVIKILACEQSVEIFSEYVTYVRLKARSAGSAGNRIIRQEQHDQ